VGSTVSRLAAVLVLAATLAAPARAATYAKGVDVSHYQGAIDWTQVATASYSFAFAKATEGSTLIDPTYPINRTGARSLGLDVGAYHFARPAGTTDPARIANAITQADFFLTVAQPQPGDLPPALDLETKGTLSATALQTWTAAWLDEIAARTGVNAVVYTSPNFWKTALADSQTVASDGHRLWVAHWTSNAAPLVPGTNWGGFGWTFWQWSDCSHVPGFAHCVDGDRFKGADPSAVAIPPYPTGLPSSSSPPTIVGAPQVAKTMAALPGTWAGGKPVTFLYQWQRCDAAGANCLPIPGATSETYVPVTTDVGYALKASVTAQTATGTAIAASPATVAVTSGGSTATRPAATTAPTVTGTVEAGQTLSSSVGTWTGAPTSFAYQWRRCDAFGAQCLAIVGATTSAYTLTPGDIGATISLVVTATGKGGSTSANAATTGVVAAAPVPAPVPASAVAQAGLAGAVATIDGQATVTWQPGAIPIGSTVTLETVKDAYALGVSPTVAQLPWPVDVAFASAPAGSVLGYSTDGKSWRPAPPLKADVLPTAQIAGAFVDANGALHALVRAPGQLRLFKPGSFGDPNLVAPGGPTPHLASRLVVSRLRDGSVRVTTRVRVPSQVDALVNVIAHTRLVHKRLLKPGVFAVNLRFHVTRGRTVRLKIATTDPYGRRASLVVPFRG
jgi:GH25 family lysozyme M1 (1,4-beta-N-acetylmuramidase)